jgi:hypothetical protein
MSDTITMVDPPCCRACNWKPVEPNNDKQEINIKNLWLIIPIPDSVVWLYVCPSCGFIMPNDNALENVKKLQKIRNRHIIHASGPKIDVSKNVLKAKLH